MLRGTFWLKVVWSPPGWRRPKTLVEAASGWDLSQRLPVKREPAKVPRERHGRNPGHSWPGGCQVIATTVGESSDRLCLNALQTPRARRARWQPISGGGTEMSIEQGTAEADVLIRVP